MTEHAKLGRQCGDCSLCCKVLRIPELSKPTNQWCDHCRPGQGCAIYETRPKVCREFECQWLTDLAIGEEWRPTRSKMVLRMLKLLDHDGKLLLDVNVDCGFPGAWLDSPYYEQLKKFCAGFAVQVNIGQRHIAILPHADVEFSKDGKDECVIAFPGRHIIVPAEKANQVLRGASA